MKCSQLCRKKISDLCPSGYDRPLQVFLYLPYPWPSQILAHPIFNKEFKEAYRMQFHCDKHVSLFAIHQLSEVNEPPALQEIADKKEVFFITFRCEEGLHFAKKYYRCEFNHLATAVTESLQEASTHSNKWQIPDPFSGKKHMMICIHGNRDQCCGEYGRKLLQDCENDKDLKNHWLFWGCSHLGGHAMSPVALDTERMELWGFMTKDLIKKVCEGSAKDTATMQHFRGQSALSDQWCQVHYRELSIKGLNSELSHISFLGIKGLDIKHGPVYVSQMLNHNKKVADIKVFKEGKVLEYEASCGKNKIANQKYYLNI